MKRLASGKPVRVWINQPSFSQPHYKLHGKRGIAIPEPGNSVRIYFTEGSLISMRIEKLSLSLC